MLLLPWPCVCCCADGKRGDELAPVPSCADAESSPPLGSSAYKRSAMRSRAHSTNPIRPHQIADVRRLPLKQCALLFTLLLQELDELVGLHLKLPLGFLLLSSHHFHLLFHLGNLLLGRYKVTWGLQRWHTLATIQYGFIERREEKANVRRR